MSSVYIKLNAGASVNYKAPVSTSSALPSSGNSLGDIRETLDTFQLYAWNGSSWQSIGGGSTTNPAGSQGSIQFNNAGSFGADASLVWDSTNKLLNMNGLAITSLSSSVSLVDGQATPVTCLSYSASTYNYSIIEYSIVRNAAQQVGMLFIANNSTSVSMSNAYANLNELGINLSANVSGGNVNIQYTTTSTGFNATFKYAIRQWI